MMKNNEESNSYSERSFALADLDIAASMHHYMEIDEIELEWINGFLTMKCIEEKPQGKQKDDFDKHWQEGPFLIKLPYSLTCQESKSGSKRTEEKESLEWATRIRSFIPEIELLVNQIITNTYYQHFDKTLKEIYESIEIAIDELRHNESVDEPNLFLCSLFLLEQKILWLLRKDRRSSRTFASSQCNKLHEYLESETSIRQLLGYFDADAADYDAYIFAVGTYDPSLTKRYVAFLNRILKDNNYLLLIGTNKSEEHLENIFRDIISLTKEKNIQVRRVDNYSSESKDLQPHLQLLSKKTQKTAIIIPPFLKGLIQSLLMDCKNGSTKQGQSVETIDVFSTASIPIVKSEEKGSATSETRIIGIKIGAIDDFF